jgi:formate dehydrogenase alpha subunit
VETIAITLDESEVSGHPGMTILELATEVGIEIPHLCYDSHLSPLGACRVCLVEEENSGRLLASCVTPIAPGMVIRTKSPRVMEHRRVVVELMLASHPDSCIVCDKGNRCRLREIATDLGLGLSNLEKIPTYHPVVDLNPFIQRDLSKCIRCGRCIRADQEIAVVGAIDYTDRGFEARPATLLDAPLERTACNFCGICVAVCPTGALSERSRVATTTGSHATRTVCTLCGTGCGILLEHREDVILGCRPAMDDGSVNHVSLCVKGHYGLDFVNSAHRLTTPLIRRNGELAPSSWDEALGLVTSRFSELKQKRGSRALGAVGASSGTNEENYLLQKLVRAAFGCNSVDSSARLRTAALMAGIEEVLGVSAMTNPFAHIREATEIFVIGADPLIESPIAGQMIKQAVRLRGAHLTLVDPMPQGLAAFSSSSLRPRPGTYPLFLAGLLREIVSQVNPDSHAKSHKWEWSSHLGPQVEAFTPEKVNEETGITTEMLKETAERLLAAQRLAVIPGIGICTEEGAYVSGVLLAALVLLTGNVWKHGCGLFPLAASLNDQGAMDMGARPEKLPGHLFASDASARVKFEQAWGVSLPDDKGLDYLSMIEEAGKGNLAGLYVVGENPVLDCPDTETVRDALSKLEFLVVQDRFLTETAEQAHVVLPSASFAEKGGTWTSVERRVQLLRQVIEPMGESRPGWSILTDLLRMMGIRAPYATSGDVLQEINETVSIYSGITLNHLEMEDVFWPCLDSDNPGTPILYAHAPQKGFVDKDLRIPELRSPETPKKHPFWLMLNESLFSSRDRTATSNSRALKAAGFREHVSMNPSDAQAANIEDGNLILIRSPVGSVKSRVSLAGETPQGTILATQGPSSLFGQLFSMAEKDPVSGTHNLNRTAVNVEVVHEPE